VTERVGAGGARSRAEGGQGHRPQDGVGQAHHVSSPARRLGARRDAPHLTRFP
jgi:hypothetical protein